jgi:hypothetical protein
MVYQELYVCNVLHKDMRLLMELMMEVNIEEEKIQMARNVDHDKE